MKRMLPLKALRPHLYGTRRLEAGDEYEAPVEEAIALVANRRADFVKGKKARFADKLPVRAPEKSADEARDAAIADFIEYMKPQAIVGQIGGNDEPEVTIDSLRMEATQLGIDIDGRWGVVRLQHEIAKAKL